MMKTTFKTLTNEKLAQQKRKEFEIKTNVKWDYYHTGQGMVFTPIVTNETVTDDNIATILLPFLTKEYQGFIKLSKTSHLKLEAVLIAAKTLVKQNKATPAVNRMGHFAAIKKTIR